MVAVVAHKGFIREFIRGPLAGLLVASSKQLKAHATFSNAEIWVLEAVWNEDDTTDSCAAPPLVRAHSLEQGASLPHMSLSTPLDLHPPAPQQKDPPQQVEHKREDMWISVPDGDDGEGGSGSGAAEDHGAWCYQAEVQQIQLMTAFG